jgi:NRPS condensation-like uncharacterized protein
MTTLSDGDAQQQVVLIDLIAGARPNFMKVAPIIRALEARREAGSRLRWRLVHTVGDSTAAGESGGGVGNAG